MNQDNAQVGGAPLKMVTPRQIKLFLGCNKSNYHTYLEKYFISTKNHYNMSQLAHHKIMGQREEQQIL
jgi:hypothetical protein